MGKYLQLGEDEKNDCVIIMLIGLNILDTLHKLLLPGESVSLFSQELKKLLNHVMPEMYQ